MIHDRLCIGSRLPEDCVWPDQCRCELIAKVRADERAVAMRDAVEAVKVFPHDAYCNARYDRQCNCLRYSVIAEIEALGGER